VLDNLVLESLNKKTQVLVLQDLKNILLQ